MGPVKRCTSSYIGLLRGREFVVGKMLVGEGHPVWRDVVSTM